MKVSSSSSSFFGQSQTKNQVLYLDLHGNERRERERKTFSAFFCLIADQFEEGLVWKTKNKKIILIKKQDLFVNKTRQKNAKTLLFIFLFFFFFFSYLK